MWMPKASLSAISSNEGVLAHDTEDADELCWLL